MKAVGTTEVFLLAAEQAMSVREPKNAAATSSSRLPPSTQNLHTSLQLDCPPRVVIRVPLLL
jgi:hypothetical protein